MSEATTLHATRAPWLSDPSVQRVATAFDPIEDCPRFVGGCVRNALIGGGPTDLDIAVLCTPEETIARLEAAGLRVIPTAPDHGTITTVTEPDAEGVKGEPIEITTLRKDVETDGRHAVVAFTRDWATDAARRDFTMNALYADSDGRVFDPLGGGLQDLADRRVRFIGRAEERIREDYLRILRFFRFTAWYGRAAPEPEDLAAVRALKDGVAGLARERIGMETKKLLGAPDPAAACALMAETGADSALYGAPLNRSADAWRRLMRVEAALELAPAWPRRLLFAYLDRADALRDTLRLSKAEAIALARRVEALGAPSPEEAAYRYGIEAALDAAALRCAEAATEPEAAAEPKAATEPEAAMIDRLRAAAAQRFPLTAKDLINAGVAPGPDLGRALKAAEEAWIANGFRLPKRADPRRRDD